MAIDIVGTIHGGLGQAWTFFAPLQKTVTYQRVLQGSYVPATGTVSQNVTSTTLRCFLIDFELQQIAGTDILSSDLRALIRAIDLPLPSGTIRKADEGDKLIDHNGETWNVAAVRGNPDFFFDIVLRR